MLVIHITRMNMIHSLSIKFEVIHVLSIFFMVYHHHQEPNTSSIPKELILSMEVISSTMLLANAFRKHKQVKAFLSLQDPILPVPSRDVDPNWKIHPILDWMNWIGPKAVQLGKCALC
jgi:hypothetical protein